MLSSPRCMCAASLPHMVNCERITETLTWITCPEKPQAAGAATKAAASRTLTNSSCNLALICRLLLWKRRFSSARDVAVVGAAVTLAANSARSPSCCLA